MVEVLVEGCLVRYGKVVTDCSRQHEVRIVGPIKVGRAACLVEVLGSDTPDLADLIRKVPR